MPLGMEVGLSPDDIVLAVDPAHPAPKGIQMALGMEVGLGPGHIVLDGDPAPPRKKGSPTPPNNNNTKICNAHM